MRTLYMLVVLAILMSAIVGCNSDGSGMVKSPTKPAEETTTLTFDGTIVSYGVIQMVTSYTAYRNIVEPGVYVLSDRGTVISVLISDCELDGLKGCTLANGERVHCVFVRKHTDYGDKVKCRIAPITAPKEK